MNIGNIITQEHEQGITYKEINLYKSIGFGMFFGQSRICFKQKKKEYYSLPPTCWKFDSCFHYLRKKQKKRICN